MEYLLTEFGNFGLGLMDDKGISFNLSALRAEMRLLKARSWPERIQEVLATLTDDESDIKSPSVQYKTEKKAENVRCACEYV